MAGYYDEQLQQLHEKMLKKQHLDKMLEDIYLQRQQISLKITTFREEEDQAKKEAARLEKGGLAGLLAGRKKEEKLEAAKKRALAAKVKVESMDAAMEALYDEAMKCREGLYGLDHCAEEYRLVYEQKMEAIKNSGSAEGEKLIGLQGKLSELREQQREMLEAEAAGNTARDTADSMLENLESADSWATWDVFGGGFLADAVKYDKLELVQKEADSLQGQLQVFRAELIDVKFGMDLNFSIDGFTRFADWFFDGIFVDWTVKTEIGRAKEHVQYFISEIDRVQKKLAEYLEENKKNMEAYEKEMEALVASVSM